MKNIFKAMFAQISQFIQNVKTRLLSLLPSADDIVINYTELKSLTPNQLTIYIQQFYQSPTEQQANTIQLPIDYLKEVLTHKDKNLTNSGIAEKYGAFFGIHPNFYWLYFYKYNVFISFCDDKILFTSNRINDFCESHNIAASDKEVSQSLYQLLKEKNKAFNTFYRLFKEEIAPFIERSKHIINCVHQNQTLKNLLTQDNNSLWPSFFNSPVASSRLDNQVFEIIAPSTHLPAITPIGSKIICYPFDGYFKKSNFYSKRFNSTAIDLDTYLEDSLANSNVNYNGYYINDYWRKIGEISKNSSLPDIDKSLFQGLDKMAISIKRQIYELCDIKIASPKLYHVFGFIKLSLRSEEENSTKIWITYEPDCISKLNFRQDFVYVTPYQGDDLEQHNIDLINYTITQINDYTKHLTSFINKTEKQLDLYNITTDCLELYELLSFSRAELERMSLHLEYLDEFKYQLFPPDNEVI